MQRRDLKSIQYQENTVRITMFSCYRWKTEGRKKKGHTLDSLVKEFLSFSYTSLSALNLRSHVPVSASMREAKTTAESYCIDAH